MIIRDLILMIYMFLMIQYVRWKIGLKRQKGILILMKVAGSQCVMKRSGLCIVKRDEITISFGNNGNWSSVIKPRLLFRDVIGEK